MSGKNIYDIGGERINCLSSQTILIILCSVPSHRKLYFLATRHPVAPGPERHQEKPKVDTADNVTTALTSPGIPFHGFCVYLTLLHQPLCDVISRESLQLLSRKLFKLLVPTLPLQRAKSWDAWGLTFRGSGRGVTFNQWWSWLGVRKPSSFASGELRHGLHSRCFW